MAQATTTTIGDGDSSWRRQLAGAVCRMGDIGCPPDACARAAAAEIRYPMFATPHYLSLGNPLDPADPVLCQCLPSPAELAPPNGTGDSDPLDEERSSPVPRLVHRYPDRALLITTSRCAVRCRHCMRKRLWDAPDFTITRDEASRALDYIAATPQVRELILSGGDPLLLDDGFLDWLLGKAFAIPSLEIVRIGTRVPVALPQRLTPAFCQLLGRHGPVWISTHFNHPRELCPETGPAILNLLQAGVPVVNQTVLLKGINDNAETLRQLFTGLLKVRIKPYYLFHGDPIDGTLHFRTGVENGLAIMDELRGRVSGLALPHFAIDLPDGGGKIRLAPDCHCVPATSPIPAYRSWDGRCIGYPVADGQKEIP